MSERDERGLLRMIERAKAGDRTQQDRLCRSFYSTVFDAVTHWVRKFPRLERDREDIAQNTWIRLFEKEARGLRGFDRGRSPGKSVAAAFKVFLRMVANQTAWRAANKKGVLRHHWAPGIDIDAILGGDGDSLEARLQARDRYERACVLVQTLSQKQIDLVEAVYLREETAKQIAARFGMTEAAVQQAKRRLRGKLAEVGRSESESESEGSSPLSGALFVLLVASASALFPLAQDDPSGSYGEEN